VIVPSLVHKTRALALIKKGQIDAALVQANLSLSEAPGDADAVIELVNALDAAGHRPEADAFYAAHTAEYRKLIETYPNSGPLHNQLAWAQVMCHRELAEAMTNGKRAVELEPTSTASMDTLAEVYFAHHDPAAAAAEMQKCVQLEPKVARHRQQLARFQAATTRP
jgi:Flp pilus assembly protein TadD